MKAGSLKGMAVVSLQEGTRLGQVEQPLFDLAARQLGGFEVKGDSGTFILPFTQIDHIGTDAITVANSQVTQAPSASGATEGLLGLQALGKLKIVDQAGTFLGTLSDVEVDLLSGQITNLEAHKGGLLGMGGTTTPIESTAIVMVGPELLTVTTDAAAENLESSEGIVQVREPKAEGSAASERWADDGGDAQMSDAQNH